jgi:hypothetical protein
MVHMVVLSLSRSISLLWNTTNPQHQVLDKLTRQHGIVPAFWETESVKEGYPHGPQTSIVQRVRNGPSSERSL